MSSDFKSPAQDLNLKLRICPMFCRMHGLNTRASSGFPKEVGWRPPAQVVRCAGLADAHGVAMPSVDEQH